MPPFGCQVWRSDPEAHSGAGRTYTQERIQFTSCWWTRSRSASMSVPISDGTWTNPHARSAHRCTSGRRGRTSPSSSSAASSTSPRHGISTSATMFGNSPPLKGSCGPALSREGPAVWLAPHATSARPPGQDTGWGSLRAARRTSARYRPGAHEASADHVTKHHKHLHCQHTFSLRASNTDPSTWAFRVLGRQSCSRKRTQGYVSDLGPRLERGGRRTTASRSIEAPKTTSPLADVKPKPPQPRAIHPATAEASPTR
jgi:hypothetical protein